ncbi:MAG: glycosyltransferase [bacterium JZ-2024 1]
MSRVHDSIPLALDFTIVCDLQTPTSGTSRSPHNLIYTGGHAGFARACNLGAQCSESPFLLFANDDLQVSSPFLPDLISALDRDPTLAAVVPPIHTRTNSGVLADESCTSFRFRFGLFYPESGKPVPDSSHSREIFFLRWATAACLLVRRSAFESVNGFDPIFSPAYCEDLDLSFRLRLAGWRLARVSTTPIFHRRAETTSRLGSDAIRDLFLRNLLVFHFRFFQSGPLSFAFRLGLIARVILLGSSWRDARNHALRLLIVSPRPLTTVSTSQLWRLLFTAQ